MKTIFRYATLSWLALMTGLAQADTGKLLLTGGVSSITGSAGGGLTPWAVIGSNATEGRSASAATSHAPSPRTTASTATAWPWA